MRTGSCALLSLILGCERPGEDSAVGACDTGPPLSWESWGHGFFTSYCQPCHSVGAPQRYGAPEGLNFDTEAQVRASAAEIRTSVLDLETMPVGGGVPDEQRALLDQFLRCEEGA